MKGIERWWYRCLSEGTPPGLMGDFDEWDQGEVMVPVQEAYRDYADGEKFAKNDRIVGRRLADFGVRKVRQTKEVDGKRPYVWVLPPLERARELFARVLGMDMEW
jgi:hypothetical protein